MVCESSVFVFKAILDIFYISNSPLARLNEFALTFEVKSGEGQGKKRLEIVEFVEWDIANVGQFDIGLKKD